MSYLFAHDRPAALRLLRRSGGLIGLAAGAASLGLFVLAKPLVFAGRGRGFRRRREQLLRWLAPLPLIIALSQVASVQILLASKRYSAFNAILIAGGVFGVLTSWIFIALFQAQGAAWFMLIVESGVCAGMWVYACGLLGTETEERRRSMAVGSLGHLVNANPISAAVVRIFGTTDPHSHFRTRPLFAWARGRAATRTSASIISWRSDAGRAPTYSNSRWIMPEGVVYFGFDLSRPSIDGAIAIARVGPASRTSTSIPPGLLPVSVRSRKLNLVLLIDILEHLPDATIFLRDFQRNNVERRHRVDIGSDAALSSDVRAKISRRARRPRRRRL